MSKCKICNRTFTCGCQKAYDETGAAVCKTCKPVQQQTVSNDLNLELAKQKIKDLTS
jgi:hypothetical protein